MRVTPTNSKHPPKSKSTAFSMEAPGRVLLTNIVPFKSYF